MTTAKDIDMPTPWRVEEDWTYEILDANGQLITKLVYPSARGSKAARLIVDAVNAYIPLSTESSK